MIDGYTSQLGTSAAADESRGLVQIVHDRLRNRILAGEFAPGEALRQEHIASEMKISRAPVREALTWLEREGLVELRPRRGFVVTSLDCEEIEEIFDIRILLEEHAGYEATLRRTRTDVEELEKLHAAMAAISPFGPEQIARWAALNRQFHERLIASSGRKHLTRMTGMLRDSVERYVRLDGAIVGNTTEADAEHRQIIDAFRDRDARAVGQLLRVHCEHTCKRLTASLRKQSG